MGWGADLSSVLDLAGPPGRVDQQVLQQVLQQLLAADQQVGQERCRDLGLGHQIAAAFSQRSPELMHLPADVADHRLGGFAAHRTEAGAFHWPTLVLRQGERRIRQ